MKRTSVSLIFAIAFFLTLSAGHIFIDGKLAVSYIYPGTVHEFKISVPDRYDGTTPAALYLGLDGVLCDAPDVIDSLIASGDMPVTIGVYLQPGVVYDTDGEVIRYNRSNEFDAIDSRFADFLEQELLPAIENVIMDDGRNLRFSLRPVDRMIFGLSSGGIAAFAAAWNRPDLFSKVFSGCGTFVPMRGGHELQALVRKTEPKPIRVCLQDGFSDTWNPLFGSWFEANSMLGSALAFAGYDCMFDWREGGHSVRRATEILPDVLKWMWRDYPAAIRSGSTSNDCLATILSDSGDWEKTGFTEQYIHDDRKTLKLSDETYADVYVVYPDSSLIAVADKYSNNIWQYLADGNGGWNRGQRFYWLHSPENSHVRVVDMSFDSNGNLWVLTTSGLQICDQNGRVRGCIVLPVGVNMAGASMTIGDGYIVIRGIKGDGWIRKLNVSPAVNGVRPESQGQA